MARPAIAAGVALAGMEVLNDYRTVKYLGIYTFTSGIFKAWFSFGDINTAIYLSAIISLMVLFLIWLENFQRGSRGWSSKNESNQPTARIKPKHKFTRWMLTSIATIVLLICFIMPLSQLIYWVSLTWKNVVDQEFFMLIYRSFSLAIGSAIIIALLSIFLLYAVRLSPLKWTKYITKVSSIGYAIPGEIGRAHV